MNGQEYISETQIYRFVSESNHIEGIERDPSEAEIEELKRFLALPKVTVEDLVHFVSVYEPSAMLREHRGMNVRVGDHVPPPGGPSIRIALQALLHRNDLSPFTRHADYETLHPFTDCNGRSGRALWLHDMKGNAPLGFLHTWYYQSLEAKRYYDRQQEKNLRRRK